MEILANLDINDTYRTGTLVSISAEEIEKILGFSCNVKDDPSKVKYSWGFTVDGIKCAVWDYKGSYQVNQFSTFGPDTALAVVFGSRYSPYS